MNHASFACAVSAGGRVTSVPRVAPFAGSIALFARAVLVAGAAVLLLLAGTRAAQAQQLIRGTVVEDSTRRPVAEVLLTLLRENGSDAGRTARTDSLGRFTLAVPARGRYRIRAQRIGYVGTITPPMMVGANEAASVEITLSRTMQLLAPMAIVAKPQPLINMLDHFEWRRSNSIGGTFITSAQIRDRIPPDLVSILRNLAGLRINLRDDGYVMESIRTANIDGSCIASVWLDGMRIRPEPIPRPGYTALSQLNDFIGVEEIHGIEVYGGRSTAPAEFNDIRATCGVIVVWTKRGRPEPPPDALPEAAGPDAPPETTGPRTD